MFENGNGGGVNTFMPVAPAAYGYGGGYGGGLFGGDTSSLILVLLLFGMFGGNWGGNGGFGGNGLYPWLNNSNQINDGFRDQMMNTTLNGIQTGMNAGFSNAEVAACNRAMDQMQTAYQGQINAIERSFAEQTANQQGFNALQSQLAQCCCDNRLATCQTQNLVSTEAAATRLANQQGNQMIMDKLCQLELDNYKREAEAERRVSDNLRTQLSMANLAASQTAQTATIQAGQRALANEIEQYVVPTPRPAYIVQNPNCCAQNTGCGCNNGFAFAG